jgi:hypothetical protein
MTSAELIEQTLRLLGVPRDSHIASRLLVLIPQALRRFPAKLEGDDREIYRKGFTVALTSGEGSLSTHTNLTSEPMIPEDVVKVTHADAVSSTNSEGKLTRVGSSVALNYSRSTQFAYYAVEDNTLYTVMNNDRTALGGNATVRAGFVPLLATVKFQHEPFLVQTLAEIAMGVIGGIFGEKAPVPGMVKGNRSRAESRS